MLEHTRSQARSRPQDAEHVRQLVAYLRSLQPAVAQRPNWRQGKP